MAIQQMLLGAGGGAAAKSYTDDVFSLITYIGNESSSARNITTNVDFINSTGVGTLTGGLSWFKKRNTGYIHALFDTVRGAE